MKRYVSDMISDEYKDWQNGEQILICTETGTGKTSFIMKKLLPYAVQHNNYIAYICNRKILKEQVTEIIQNQIRALFPDDLAFADNCINHMIIRTYQYCEIAKEYPSFREETHDDNSYILKDEIMYYIFDEAHYFIQDSIFNYQTNYWTSKKFNDRVTVFLTATPEPLLCFLYGRRHINDIDKKQQFSKEIINYYIAKRQASRIQKIYDIDMETDKFTIEVSTPEKSDIKAHLQEIKPYKEFFSIINYAVTIIDNNSTLKNNRLRIYNSKKQDYGYITPYYFNDYLAFREFMLYA